MVYVDIFLCTRHNTGTLSYKWLGRWHITVRIAWFLDFVHRETSDSNPSVGKTQFLRTISPEEGGRASLLKHLFIYQNSAVGEIQTTKHPNFQIPSMCCYVTEHVWACE